MNVTALAVAMAGTVLLLGACSREPAPAENAAAPTAGSVQIGNFGLGTSLGRSGLIAPGAATTLFETGQRIYLAMELISVPVDTPVSVTWNGPGDLVLGEETKQVLLGQKTMHFVADSAGLPIGKGYGAEISVQGRTVGEVSFELILASP